MSWSVGIAKRYIIVCYIILSILEAANSILCFTQSRAIR